DNKSDNNNNKSRNDNKLSEREKSWIKFLNYILTLIYKYYSQNANQRKLFSLAVEKLLTQFLTLRYFISQKFQREKNEFSAIHFSIQRILSFCLFSNNTHDFTLAFSFNKKNEGEKTAEKKGKNIQTSFQASFFDK